MDMKLLDRDATEDEIRAFQKEMNVLSEKLRKNHIFPEKIHGWCGAEGEGIPTSVRMNMWYLHLVFCESLIGTKGKESRRGKRA